MALLLETGGAVPPQANLKIASANHDVMLPHTKHMHTCWADPQTTVNEPDLALQLFMFLQLVDEELLAIAKVVKCRYVATGQVGTQ